MLRPSRIVLALIVAVLLTPADAHAQGKAKPAPKVVKGKKPAPKAPAKEEAKETEAEEAPAEAKPTGAPEGAVKAAGTKEKPEKTGDQARVTSVEESQKDKGVKTYKFETIEVEGRLKSPQVIYFLRRVRAEFEAGALGHRSFLGELSDSRRSAAFR